MTSSTTDPLKSLISDDIDALNKEKIATFLKPFLSFDKEGEIGFRADFGKLKDNTLKIEILLLASKVRALLFPEKEEGLLPKEIINMQIMPEGSTKTAIKTLADNKKIRKNKNGGYCLPSYRVDDIITTETN